ncbi:PREDICTED: cytochrome P450 4C1-like isoform X2 [Vollenhovia emeryi]|uniref:cytochrome P450 4C1-like isoform X2 n=1 Tax=Vollenhovia emeryi TaxID=411798 RepID=UPI0005F3D735|nr:PREDICTED: cytochrome P450 4C1-like isoform X2 [Vollenhovia emeryi]
MITIVFLSFILILLICNYYVHHGKNGRFINRIPGPPGLPILGNLLQSFGSREKLWHLLISLSTQYYPIFKYWQIFFPIVSIRHPDDLETILSSPKHIEKSILYDVYHPWLSTGLLTSGGQCDDFV